jgi:hypothetical protein
MMLTERGSGIVVVKFATTESQQPTVTSAPVARIQCLEITAETMAVHSAISHIKIRTGKQIESLYIGLLGDWLSRSVQLTCV